MGADLPPLNLSFALLIYSLSRTFLFFPDGDNCHIHKLVEYSRFSLIEEKVDLVEKGEILFD